ncbi:probable polygalacturonase At1g80170 isoform X2 [Olea europaea var. sylvestris]|uniref:probable polygalacturonase At1g80170 isoform X2 n=1 Tax=Olea europaea var. sylvestris TaxID=158386 RepID=UPI000C1CE57D|nr:probable polygalacturonase At1g80170 isoform X2 [Olea europaea var. sylvestris]
MEMVKLRKLSFSNAYSSHSVYSFNYIVYICICLLLFVTNANGFSPTIQLPTSGLFRNTSYLSKTLVLNINDFGAQGDGFTDDTKPCTHAPTAITFHRCKNLKVRNLTTINSQQMHMAFTTCRRVAVSHLNVLAPADSPNTDGIHISASKRVKLTNIIVSTGDDCISIVSNSSRIHMKNIVCGPGHGISIGSLGKANSSAYVQNVSLDGAYLFNTENGLRIKTWQGGSGFARKIKFQNVWMKNVSNPIIIDQYYCDSSSPCPNQTSSVSIDSVSFRNIRGTSATEVAILFACSESFPCRRLYLKNIQLTSASGGITRSFCWEAYGKSSGLIYPAPCISSGEMIIGVNVKSNSTQRHKVDYALL